MFRGSPVEIRSSTYWGQVRGSRTRRKCPRSTINHKLSLEWQSLKPDVSLTEVVVSPATTEQSCSATAESPGRRWRLRELRSYSFGTVLWVEAVNGNQRASISIPRRNNTLAYVPGWLRADVPCDAERLGAKRVQEPRLCITRAPITCGQTCKTGTTIADLSSLEPATRTV